MNKIKGIQLDQYFVKTRNTGIATIMSRRASFTPDLSCLMRSPLPRQPALILFPNIYIQLITCDKTNSIRALLSTKHNLAEILTLNSCTNYVKADSYILPVLATYTSP